MLKNYPPYLFHCEAGMDRTGFFAILLEAFMDAGLEVIAKDYMLSYVDDDEYSDVDREVGSEFVLHTFTKIAGRPVWAYDDLQRIAEKYLAERVGLKPNELIDLKKKLIQECS